MLAALQVWAAAWHPFHDAALPLRDPCRCVCLNAAAAAALPFVLHFCSSTVHLPKVRTPSLLLLLLPLLLLPLLLLPLHAH